MMDVDGKSHRVYLQRTWWIDVKDDVIYPERCKDVKKENQFRNCKVFIYP